MTKPIKLNKKICQRLIIKLKKDDRAYLITENDTPYCLHHLINNYESLIIEVKRETK